MHSGSRRWLTLLAACALLIYVLGVLLLAVRALLPESAFVGDGFLTRFSDPNSWWGLTLILAAGGTFWMALTHLKVSRKKRSSVVPLLSLGATTIVLGLASYLPCAGGQAPFWAPTTWTIALFAGSAEDPFGTIDGCSAPLPLALQLARLTALLVLSLGIAGVVGVLFRERLDRARTRRARSLIFVVGVDEKSLSLLRRVRSEAPRRTLVAVLVDEDATVTVRDSARAMGCAVLDLGTENLRLLVPLIRAGRSGDSGIVALYCVRSDTATNLRTFRAFREAATELGPSTQRPRAVIRVDDPWQAEYWRRSAVGSRDGWILDTTSVSENTARVVVRGVLDRKLDQVALIGDSPLALAILAEFAQQQRELDASRFETTDAVPKVWTVGPRAADLVDQHVLRQQRFGNQSSAFTPEAAPGAADWQNLEGILQSANVAGVIITDPEFAGREASPLAARRPHWTIFSFDPDARSLPLEAVMEQLFSFGSVNDPTDGAAIDSWERVARIAHANYVHQVRQSGGDLNAASAQPWESLSAFYRESNVRLITTTLKSADAIGRSWAAEPYGTGAEGTRGGNDLTADEVRRMARLEHESWLAHHRDNGWRWSAIRADADRLHPLLVPWAELPDDAIDKNERTVLDALDLLAALGYHSIPAP